MYQVTFVTGQRQVEVEVRDDQYLLDAANEAGLDLPFMCLQGWYTTCAGRVLEGEVDQSEARWLYPADEEAGFVLLCSAFPRSDLRILTHQREAMREHRAADGSLLRLSSLVQEQMLSRKRLGGTGAWLPRGITPSACSAAPCSTRRRGR